MQYTEEFQTNFSSGYIKSLRKLTVFDYKDIFKFIINYIRFKFNSL